MWRQTPEVDSSQLKGFTYVNDYLAVVFDYGDIYLYPTEDLTYPPDWSTSSPESRMVGMEIHNGKLHVCADSGTVYVYNIT